MSLCVCRAAASVSSSRVQVRSVSYSPFFIPPPPFPLPSPPSVLPLPSFSRAEEAAAVVPLADDTPELLQGGSSSHDREVQQGYGVSGVVVTASGHGGKQAHVRSDEGAAGVGSLVFWRSCSLRRILYLWCVVMPPYLAPPAPSVPTRLFPLPPSSPLCHHNGNLRPYTLRPTP